MMKDDVAIPRALLNRVSEYLHNEPDPNSEAAVLAKECRKVERRNLCERARSLAPMIVERNATASFARSSWTEGLVDNAAVLLIEMANALESAR